MVNNFAHVTGGADRNVFGLTAALRDRGHEVALLATSGPDDVEDQGAFIYARVTHASRDELGLVSRVDVAARALWNPDAAAAMRRLLAEFRPHVVHTHKLYPQLSVAPIVVGARAGIPIVQTLHDYELLSAGQLDHRGGWVDHDEAKLSYRALNTATFPLRREVYARRVSAWIACSRFVAAQYRTKGISATVLPYFVESAEAVSPDFSSRRGVVFVGRLSEEKGVLDVIDLAELLPSIDIAVVGFGPLEGRVAEASRRLPNLDVVGRLDREGVMSMLRTARVFLMPSRWQEPGGIAALEAMSVGTPVVAYETGGLAEYVGDAEGGLVSRRARRRSLERAVSYTMTRLAGASAPSVALRQSAARTPPNTTFRASKRSTGRCSPDLGARDCTFGSRSGSVLYGPSSRHVLQIAPANRSAKDLHGEVIQRAGPFPPLPGR